MDEPTLGLNADLGIRSLTAFSEMIARERRAALIVEHNIDVVSGRVTRLCVMKNGRIAYDGGVGLLADRERLRAIYL